MQLAELLLPLVPAEFDALTVTLYVPAFLIENDTLVPLILVDWLYALLVVQINLTSYLVAPEDAFQLAVSASPIPKSDLFILIFVGACGVTLIL